MRTLLVFVAGGFASWLLRVAFIALAPSGQPPPPVARLLRYAAPAAFASLIAASVSGIATGDGRLAGWPVLAATAVTLVVAWRTGRVLLTFAVGVAAATVFATL